ncbi:MAG: hypothetical protein ACXW2P_04130 [Thermoanaerobaculia bacterium]
MVATWPFVYELLPEDGQFAFYPEERRAHEKSLTSILFEPGEGTVPISSATSDDSTRDVL